MLKLCCMSSDFRLLICGIAGVAGWDRADIGKGGTIGVEGGKRESLEPFLAPATNEIALLMLSLRLRKFEKLFLRRMCPSGDGDD
jgi:hypothetical protein